MNSADDYQAKALDLLDREWTDLDAWLRGLTPAQLDRPVFGEGPGWRVRDMITHMAWWQEVAGKVARKMAADGGVPDERGSRPFLGLPPVTVDEQNAMTDEQWRSVSLDERWQRWRAAHSEMVAAIRALQPQQVLNQTDPEGIQRWFSMPGIVHLRIHRPHIEAALKETTTP